MLLNAAVKALDLDAANDILKEMIGNDIRPCTVTFGTILAPLVDAGNSTAIGI